MIRIICVGRLKGMLREAEQEYIKRIGFYAKAELIEIPEYKSSNSLECLKKEGERIKGQLKGFVIVLDANGSQLPSERFAELLRNHEITFVIGSHLGLSEDIKKMANASVSFSKMTFPHQLLRIMLLEQVYRGFTILKGQPYHK